MPMRALCSFAFVVSMTCASGAVAAQSFNHAFDDIRARPEFAHSSFGVEIWSLDKSRVLYAFNGDKLFVPGSTTKLLTEGTALKLFGPDHRFHTPVYRTGAVKNGVLKGNLVLVGSGDPDLSGRAQPDGTLAFANEDHSYGGFDSKLIGDPVAALKDIARQVAASGIREIDGQVLIDASLFPEGAREGGTNVVISPVIVNDNVVDIVVTPGDGPGKPAKAVPSPLPSYMRLIDKVKTGAPGSKFTLETKDETLDGGAVAVTESGSIPAGKGTYVDSYAVTSPSRFAAALLVQCLESAGVKVGNHAFPGKPTGDANKAWYKPENLVAELTSPPLSEDVRITLKVSQNLHAAVMPYDVGALLGGAKTKVQEAGFHLEQEMLKKAGLDVSGASQGDGPGAAALFTPDFMVHYLAWWSTQPTFSYLRNGLPVLGRDGTLWNIQRSSPAAGRVFAKTGTDGQDDLLNASLTIKGKGLAGYTTTRTGERVAFAIYINNVPLDVDREDDLAKTNAIAKLGNVLGEIAADANTLAIEGK
jgi:PBP4 family serine-type D-alanyl-D-alanine carboxypeptidase